ncbi:MAG: hypothetical protein KF778_00415 [Rhodocyclaceae bacterium]|nr:hypothetical protein [Rhodocyclaceae bacterium]MBX3666843.1 hypothetical protein [Rhodocyclaceae bacterium]
MSKYVFFAAFVLGAAAVGWVGVAYVGSNPLALVMTAMIAAVYVLGAAEMLAFRRATGSLAAALADIPEQPPSLGDWLARLHPALRNAVRGRIEGERAGLPGPALTPYLIGLLVMLGMLGTFLGMVVTLNGAVFALEGTTDVAAIRSALAVPIKGLGLAFGTSVAGVAASASLGLMSALARRERALLVQALDACVAGSLRGFSAAHQRQETYKALQMQAGALPDVVEKLHALMQRMERMDQQLGERLLANQENFHGEAKQAYAQLAASVEKSLKESLTDSARAAGNTIQPAVQAAMGAIARETQSLHEKLTATTQTQLDGMAARLGATADTLLANQADADRRRVDAWTRALDASAATLAGEWQQAGAQTSARQQEICTALAHTARDLRDQALAQAGSAREVMVQLTQAADEWGQSRRAADAESSRQQSERMDALLAAWRSEAVALREQEAQRGEAAVARLGELQAALARHLTTLGEALEQPIARLVQTASDVPRAAAEVIAQLRQEISSSVARDNEMLAERSRILQTLDQLLTTIHKASSDQRSTIDALVGASANALAQAGSRFAERVDGESARLEQLAAQIAGGAVEMSSLSEAFGFAVQLFNDGNRKLIENLQSIEAAMDKSALRSDEQISYYVAQAREVIDLSIMSQKEIVDALREIKAGSALIAGAVN